MKNKYLIFVALLFSSLLSSSQSSFEKVIGQEKDEVIYKVLFNDQNELVLFGGIHHHLDSSYMYVLKLDINGNILDSKIIVKDSSAYQTIEDVFIINGKYYLLGVHHYYTYGDYFLNILDENFDELSYHEFGVPDDRRSAYMSVILDADSNFCFTGYTWGSSYETIGRNYIYKISLTGDSLYSHFWNGGGSFSHYTAIVEDTVKSEYYTFGRMNFQSPQYSLMVFNHNMDSIASYVMEHPPGPRVSAKWLNDTSIIVAGRKASTKMSIETINRDFEESNIQYYQKIPSMGIEYPGIYNGLSIYDSSVYIGGTSDMHQNMYTSSLDTWVHLVKLNTDMSFVWEKWYGGDACYVVHDVLAIQDGGCFVVGTRYDENTSENLRDIYLLKVNADGIITWEKEIPIPTQNALVFPNPGKDQLNLKSTITNATFQLTNMQGKSLIKQYITQENTSFNTQKLPAGTYLWTLTHEGKVVESGKWVKD